MRQNLLLLVLTIVFGYAFHGCSNETVLNEPPSTPVLTQTTRAEGTHQLALTIRGAGLVLSPMDEVDRRGGTGYYPNGEKITLQAEPENFLYWIINGEEAGENPQLDITLDEDMDIMAVTMDCVTITVTGAGTVTINGTGPSVTSNNSPYKYFTTDDYVDLYAEGAKFYGWEYGADNNLYTATLGENVKANFGSLKTMTLNIDADDRYANITVKGYAYKPEDGEPSEFEESGRFSTIGNFAPEKGLEINITNKSRYRLSFIASAPLGSEKISLSSGGSGTIKLSKYDFGENDSFASVRVSAL